MKSSFQSEERIKTFSDQNKWGNLLPVYQPCKKCEKKLLREIKGNMLNRSAFQRALCLLFEVTLSLNCQKTYWQPISTFYFHFRVAEYGKKAFVFSPKNVSQFLKEIENFSCILSKQNWSILQTSQRKTCFLASTAPQKYEKASAWTVLWGSRKVLDQTNTS